MKIGGNRDDLPPIVVSETPKHHIEKSKTIPSNTSMILNCAS